MNIYNQQLGFKRLRKKRVLETNFDRYLQILFPSSTKKKTWNKGKLLIQKNDI